jgi:formate transporter
MYFVPLGILIRDRAPQAFWEVIAEVPADHAALNWSNFLVDKVVPVTIGNVIGGVALVGGTYWFVYLRPRSS